MAQDKRKKPYGFWNWGTGIAIAITAGALGMIFLVYKSVGVEFDMVVDDYYEQEINYEKKIKAQKEAKRLSAPLKIIESEDLITVIFPEECIGQDLQEETLFFYRPSNKIDDVHLPFVLDENGALAVSKEKMIKGLYRLKADWIMNDVYYNIEQDFFVQKN